MIGIFANAMGSEIAGRQSERYRKSMLSGFQTFAGVGAAAPSSAASALAGPSADIFQRSSAFE